MPRSIPRPVPSTVLKTVESPHDRFIRLANQRAKPVIKYLRMIGRLGDRSYTRTSEEIDRLEAVLQAELDRAIDKLRETPREDEIGDVL